MDFSLDSRMAVCHDGTYTIQRWHGSSLEKGMAVRAENVQLAHEVPGGVRPSRMSAEQLVAALDGKIAPVKLRWGYKAGLTAVAAVMLLLPLLYASMIGSVIAGIIWYIMHMSEVLPLRATGRVSPVILLIYLAPIPAGAILVVFMIKPLFARRSSAAGPLAVSCLDQPALYAFVGRLCEIVGAPAPSRIEVDCQVNASASFEGGLAGLFSGKLVLTVGLPLVAGMSLRQLTGVLAHEFGHFSQGTGMRLTFIVRFIDAWFSRVVYERDVWDQRLIRASYDRSNSIVSALAKLTRMMVWITRRILWVLMYIGHLTSSFMLRQMELDADRYEAQLTGSGDFAGTSERVVMLTAAQSATFHELMGAWRERRLSDDLPKMIAAREQAMPADVRTSIQKWMGEHKTGWLDTHPCHATRRKSAMEEAAPGMFHVKGPATGLFRDFAQLSRRVTEAFYRQNLGRAFRGEQLVASESIVSQTNDRQAAMEALARFFQGLVHPVRPVFPRQDTEIQANLQATVELIQEERDRLLAGAAEARAASRRWHEIDRQWVAALQVYAMRRGGASVEAVRASKLEFKGDCDVESLRAHIASLEAQRKGHLEKINAVLQGSMARVNIMLAFAEAQRREQIRDTTDHGEYSLVETGPAGSNDRVLEALNALSMAAMSVEQLRRECCGLRGTLSLVKPSDNPAVLVALIMEQARSTHEDLGKIHSILRGVSYPYEHTERGASISRFVLDRMPGPRDIRDVLNAAEITLNAVYGLYMRLMGDLCKRAEEWERSLGLEPLPEVQVKEGEGA